MRNYFEIAGIGCILYYILIAGYTRKWNSTFAGFWVLCGGAHFMLAVCYPVLPGYGRKLICGMLAAGWILFCIIAARILGAMRKDTDGEVRYLIVLGAQVRGTRITNSLMRRLNRAYEYLTEHPETVVIVSGGQGKGEAVSEAEAMAANLEMRGIDSKRVILEDRSTSTRENLLFSAAYIGDLAQPTALVTNNFHVFRSLMIGRQVGYTNLEGIAASSNPVLFVNYLVREFFAVLLTKIKSML